MRRGPFVALVAVGFAAACAAPASVEVENADRVSGELTADAPAGLPEVASPTPGADGANDSSSSRETTIGWAGCDDFGVPDWVGNGTGGWECGRLAVEMDPYDGTAGLPTVELAVTRHRATGERLGSILVNPGGPGAAGLPTAWAIRPSMPTELLRGFDIVAWDPRGVGRSEPRADCGGALSFDDGFIATCVEATGPLSGHLSAPYSAADMEALRVALGEDELNFLGFSYGSILGATYAARHPDTVGAFVLDGVTDPDAGSVDGPFEDGFAVFADDGRPAAYDRLVELCNATDRCLPGADADDVINGLGDRVSELPTPLYAGEPDRVGPGDLDEYIDFSLAYAGDWELLAVALEDADAGDASALASAVAGTESIDDPADPDDGSDGDDTSSDNFADANYMIYCADFGPLITEWSFCDAMPVNAQPLRPVTSVEIDRPMLVIGTEYDPLTPGKHAPDFAEAIGDAVHIIWDGVGHTAFPAWTDCIDDVVADQFLDRPLPPDGTRCSMLEGVDDDAELGETLFGFDRNEAADWIADSFELTGTPSDEATCLANEIVPSRSDEIDDQLVGHLVLEVTSEAAVEARTLAAANC